MASIGAADVTRRPSPNPLDIRGTPLPPNVLLAAKLVVVVFLIKGLWQLTDPFLPFLGFLGHLTSPQVFQHALQVIWLLAAAALLMNQWVRSSCCVLGGTILVALFASQAYRTNNLTFSGLLLLLIGLSDRRTAWTIIRMQLAVLYFWAGVNKLLDDGWRSGAFFDTFNAIQGYGGIYHTLSSELPGRLLSALLSWGAILTELFLAFGFAIRRLVFVSVVVMVAYHSSLFLLTGATFTTFWFALVAAGLALTEWPVQRPCVYCGATGRIAWLCGALRKLDLGGQFLWEPHPGSGVRIVVGERAFDDRHAVARILFYHPTVWVIFYALAAAPLPQPRWAALVALAAVGYAAAGQITGRHSFPVPVRA